MNIPLDQLAEKARNRGRFSPREGLLLLRDVSLHDLGSWANTVKERLHGNTCFYAHIRHIDYSNICQIACRFCSFSRRWRGEGAFELTLDEVLAKAKQAEESGATQLHIVGGIHPDLPFDYFLEMLGRLSRSLPSMHLKCFTAVEIDHFCEITGLSVGDVLQRLKEAGLDSMAGGGAEVFSERLREKLFPNKISADRWLEIHRTAHEMGISTNATLLYGHIETDEELVDHLCRLRELQDQTGGFETFVPLAYCPKGNRLGGRGPSGQRSLRVIATARLVLDNFPHIKAYWVTLGVKLAQVALRFGADDFHGTVGEENIMHMAGAGSPQQLTVEEIRHLISQAGWQPVERRPVTGR